jgi:hypothetical protein
MSSTCGCNSDNAWTCCKRTHDFFRGTRECTCLCHIPIPTPEELDIEVVQPNTEDLNVYDKHRTRKLRLWF